MHLILLGTSSVGKSSISQYFKDIGYVHISCDDYINIISTNVEKKFYDSHEEQIRDRNEPMYQRGLQEKTPYILYDDITMDVCNFYENRNDYSPNSLYKILLYPSITRIVNNVYSRRFSQKRTWDLFDQYPNFYTLAKDDDSVIDVINKQEFIQLLKDKLQYLFTSEQDLLEKVNTFFISLGANEQDEVLSLTIRKDINPHLFIKIEDQTPYEIFEQIRLAVHPEKLDYRRIFITGPICTGKTLLCNELTKIGYQHVDYKFYEKRIDPQFDTKRYYSMEESDFYETTLSMYNVKADKIVYEDYKLSVSKLYGENNQSLFTIFVYLNLEQIVKNMKKQAHVHFRYPELLYDLSEFYVRSESTDDEPYTLTIQYHSFRQLLLDHIQFLFFSEEHLEKCIRKIFKNLSITEIDKDKHYTLRLKNSSQYNLIIDMNKQKASDIIPLLQTQ
jgi:broad-specificity NMP kinase